jgi:hypothetical protein
MFLWNLSTHLFTVSRESIATRYGLEGPGIDSRWGEIFRTYPDLLRGPPSLPYNGYRVFPGGKGGRGVILTTHPLLVPRWRKCWAIPPLTLWVLLGLLRGSLYLLFIYQITRVHKIKDYKTNLSCCEKHKPAQPIWCCMTSSLDVASLTTW